MIPSGKAEFARANMENSRMLCFLGGVDLPLDLFKVLQGRDTRFEMLSFGFSLLALCQSVVTSGAGLCLVGTGVCTTGPEGAFDLICSPFLSIRGALSPGV